MIRFRLEIRCLSTPSQRCNPDHVDEEPLVLSLSLLPGTCLVCMSLLYTFTAAFASKESLTNRKSETKYDEIDDQKRGCE